ncbi:unnamed protein product [Blepharisma stoltei]|uniref:Uncharacterized protein n=1 Tax=Blepharisma stoltei TaxID=1481888 RepID=A0AAU9JV51_9CILI|nr:unnamed protein product [Blepharisma stoltei]
MSISFFPVINESQDHWVPWNRFNKRAILVEPSRIARFSNSRSPPQSPMMKSQLSSFQNSPTRKNQKSLFFPTPEPSFSDALPYQALEGRPKTAIFKEKIRMSAHSQINDDYYNSLSNENYDSKLKCMLKPTKLKFILTKFDPSRLLSPQRKQKFYHYPQSSEKKTEKNLGPMLKGVKIQPFGHPRARTQKRQARPKKFLKSCSMISTEEIFEVSQTIL